jgi:hypothetical protein
VSAIELALMLRMTILSCSASPKAGHPSERACVPLPSAMFISIILQVPYKIVDAAGGAAWVEAHVSADLRPLSMRVTRSSSPPPSRPLSSPPAQGEKMSPSQVGSMVLVKMKETAGV